MATKLTKNVARTVVDERGVELTVTLTAEGVLFRRPRTRSQYLLPYLAGETRAQMLECGAGLGPRPSRGAPKTRSLI